jgi:hypothetical protein
MVGLLSRRALVHPASYHTRDSSRARPLLSVHVLYTITTPAVPDLSYLTTATCARTPTDRDARCSLCQ